MGLDHKDGTLHMQVQWRSILLVPRICINGRYIHMLYVFFQKQYKHIYIYLNYIFEYQMEGQTSNPGFGTGVRFL